MLVRTNDERDADVKAVETWLWHHGEWPGCKKIGTCLAFWVDCWEREKNNGMDILASMYADHILELANELKGI